MVDRSKDTPIGIMIALGKAPPVQLNVERPQHPDPAVRQRLLAAGDPAPIGQWEIAMFVGHYGVSFAAKRLEQSVSLWALFIAVQLLDVLWAPFVLLGIEKVRIVPGITASNPLDLYYMPYTHSLLAALLWAAAALLLYRFLAGPGRAWRPALVIGLAVFLHWVLDFLVHRPDLPLYDDTAKVGLGLWNLPVVAFALEAALLFGGMWLYLSLGPGPRLPMMLFGLVMLAIQAYVFFGPPPASERAAAVTALAAYAVFAAVVARLERPRRPTAEETARTHS